MDNQQLQERAKQLIKYLCTYLDEVEQKPTLPDVKPGFLKQLIPHEAPVEPESWEDVFNDIDKIMMKGVHHCRSPHSHDYTPRGCSHASLLATILSDTLSNYSTLWEASPFMVELEDVVLDWLVKMMNLPDHFLSQGPGCGYMQSSGTEGSLMTLIYARQRAIQNASPTSNGNIYDTTSRLVAYFSDETHKSAERVCVLALIQSRMVVSNERCQMTGAALREAVEKDEEKGLVPFYVTVSLGTTATFAFDELKNIGQLCAEKNIWLHVDAVGSGPAFICPEYRYLMEGIEYADSFCLNPYKWLLVHCPCSILWLRNKQHSQIFDTYGNTTTTTYFNWQWPLASARKVKSVNLWFVMRLYGQSGLQKYIRKDIALTKEMEALLLQDGRFEIVNEVIMWLVCFKLKGKTNETNEQFFTALRDDRRLWLTGWQSKGMFFLRFVGSTCEETQSRHIKFAFEVIKEIAQRIIQ